MPSWQFFNEVAPSPRIEFAVLDTKDQEISQWQDLVSRKQEYKISDFFKSIFFNPEWNQKLYLINCAEKIVISQSKHAVKEIFKAILEKLKLEGDKFVCFRLVFISKKSEGFREDILYQSSTKQVQELDLEH